MDLWGRSIKNLVKLSVIIGGSGKIRENSQEFCCSVTTVDGKILYKEFL